MGSGRVTQSDPALYESGPSGIVREGTGTFRAGAKHENTRDWPSPARMHKPHQKHANTHATGKALEERSTCRYLRFMGVRLPEPKADSHEMHPRRSVSGQQCTVRGMRNNTAHGDMTWTTAVVRKLRFAQSWLVSARAAVHCAAKLRGPRPRTHARKLRGGARSRSPSKVQQKTASSTFNTEIQRKCYGKREGDPG